MMNVTNVDFITFTPQPEGICAEVVITLDDALLVHHVRVINGKHGMFVAYPNSGWVVSEEGKKHYRDIVHPKSQVLRSKLEKDILSYYEKKVEAERQK